MGRLFLLLFTQKINDKSTFNLVNCYNHSSYSPDIPGSV